MTPGRALIWILCLAFAAVGMRNFETGLSLDGPIYSTIARNIAVTGEWFRLDASLSDYRPYFTDHPHLALWIQALFFRWLPDEDWVARMTGHLCYVAFLFLFFRLARKRSGELAAVWAVCVLWTWYQFSNVFSNAYIDPVCLTLGMGSLVAWDAAWDERSRGLACLAGLLLAASAMAKGATSVGFLPALLVIPFAPRREPFRLSYPVALVVTATAALALYALAIRSSQAPDFLRLYWERQFSGRFLPARSLGHVFEAPYWTNLLRYTYGMAPLALLTLPRLRREPALRLPWVAATTFALLYASVRLNGGQYLVYVMPWIAWLVGTLLAALLTVPGVRVARWTAVASVVAVVFLQYVPFRAHAREVGPEYWAIRSATRDGKSRVVLDLPVYPEPRYLLGGSFAWYGRMNVEYRDPHRHAPPADGRTLYLLADARRDVMAELTEKGWCRRETFPGLSLWQTCPDGAARIGETSSGRFNHGE